MAAPTPCGRVTPTGTPMRNGYQALISFLADPDVLFWEKDVKPPGMDGGNPINTSTMHNTTYMTFSHASLATLTPSTCKVAYDVDLYTDILELLNIDTSITVHFSTGRYLCFFGFLHKFDPADMVNGQQPEATITIQPTNYDATNHVEASPIVGTGT